jgi:hypothetical protein
LRAPLRFRRLLGLRRERAAGVTARRRYCRPRCVTPQTD